MAHGTKLRRLYEDVGELLARSTSGLSRDELHGYRGRFPEFCRDLFGIELTPQQIEAGRSLESDDTPQLLVQGGQGVGKDTLLACWSMFEVYVHDALALLSAPVERSVREVTMRREIGRLWSRAAGKLEGERYEMAIRIPGREPTGILAFTASDPEKFVGHHAPRVFIGLTEGQAIPAGIFEAAQRCQPDTLLVICNPVTPNCAAYGLSRSAAWETLTWSCLDHPNVLEDREVVPGAVSSGWVNRMRQEKGEGSRFWRYAVLGEWPEESESALIRREWWEKAVERSRAWRPGRGEWVPPTVGVDPARKGKDRTGVAVVADDAILELHRWREVKTTDNARRVENEARRLLSEHHGVEEVVVDSVAVGGGVLDELEERLSSLRYDRPGRGRFGAHRVSVRARGFKSSRKAGQPERFANRRAEVFHHVSQLFERDKIVFGPDVDPDLLGMLREELLHTSVIHGADDRMNITPKDEIRSTLGRSPDVADAVAMAFSAQVPDGKKKVRFR